MSFFSRQIRRKILQNIFSWQNLPFYCSAHHKNLIIFIYLTLEKQKKASEGFTTTFSLDTYTELLLLLYQVFFVSVVVTILQYFTMFCLFTHHLRNSHFPLFYFHFLKMSVRHMGWRLWKIYYSFNFTFSKWLFIQIIKNRKNNKRARRRSLYFYAIKGHLKSKSD